MPSLSLRERETNKVRRFSFVPFSPFSRAMTLRLMPTTPLTSWCRRSGLGPTKASQSKSHRTEQAEVVEGGIVAFS